MNSGISKSIFTNLGLAILILANSGSTLLSQILDSFEDQKSNWILNSTSDTVTKRTWQNEVTNATSKSGRSSILLQCESSSENRVVVTRVAEPLYAIAELNPSLWVKTDGCDVQLSVRVVLPHSKSPNSDNPISVLVNGPVSRLSGEWQLLKFGTSDNSLYKLLEQKKWLLRERFQDTDIKIENAYIDLIKLELRTRRGLNRVWLDDLKIEGAVPATQIAEQVRRNGALVRDNKIKLMSGVQENEKPVALAVQNASIIESKGQPITVRSIEHSGESFQALMQMGFNTIELNTPPTESQRTESIRLGLWLICPPPNEVGLYSLDQSYDRVLAWKLGPNLTEKDIQQTQTVIREIRQSDFRRDRPIMVDVQNSWTAYGRLGNVLGLRLDTTGTSFPLRQYSDWISRWRKAAGNPPTYCSIPTELSRELMDQVAAIANRTPPTPLSPEQIRYATYEAIAGGGRGIRFRSRTRLDAGDPSTRLRATTLQWLNRQLMLLEPWIAGGAVMGTIDQSTKNLDITEIKTAKGRLLLMQKSTGNEQFFCGDAQVGTQLFDDSNSTTADQAYWISDTGLIPKSKDSLGGRLSVDITDTGTCAAFVVTQSQPVLNQLHQIYGTSGGQLNSGLQFQITQNWLAITQLLDRQNTEVGGGNVAVQSQVDQATTFTQQAIAQAANRTNLTANRFLAQANEQLAFARREMMISARRGFSNATASPLTMHCTLLPEHMKLVSRIAQSNWNPNGLAGGDFENLEHMKNNGWLNLRSDDDFVQTQVQLTKKATVRGDFGLQLDVWPRQNENNASQPSLVENVPVWIMSGEVPVKAGQLVRIHGWVNIPQAITSSPDGLFIEDSITGRAIGERFRSTNGWQEFTLYRGVSQNGNIRVKFSMTGIGSAMLDEVTIKTMDLPPTNRNAQLNPRVGEPSFGNDSNR